MRTNETLTATLCKNAKMRSAIATKYKFVTIMAVMILSFGVSRSVIGAFGVLDALTMLAACAQLAVIHFYGLTRKYAEDRLALSLAYSLVYGLTMLRIAQYKNGVQQTSTNDYKVINDLSDFCVRIGDYRGQHEGPHVEGSGWQRWISYQQREMQPTQADMEMLLRALITDHGNADTYRLIIELMAQAMTIQASQRKA